MPRFIIGGSIKFINIDVYFNKPPPFSYNLRNGKVFYPKNYEIFEEKYCRRKLIQRAIIIYQCYNMVF
jgi:hypothetical protein